MHYLRHMFATAAVLALIALEPRAQMRVMPLDDLQGHVALGLALRHLANTGTLMMATAHPDDENNGLLVMLNRGMGYRTVLATATRGNGGQNEIGPEIFEALGVLRTEELAAIHRFDGAEQYFTRAVDFGFSFSIEETFEKWGRDEITEDFVRLIRMTRPDVMTGLSPEGTGGGQHHQASAVIARDAFKMAGDPTKYPEQIQEGLKPWQPKKLYFAVGFGGGSDAAAADKRLEIALSGYDGLLGKTYSEIGTEARSMHKCQGMAQLLALPAPVTTSYRLVETALPGQMQRTERFLFDNVDSTIQGLAQFAGPRPPKELTEGLGALAAAVQVAQKKFDTETDAAVVAPLLVVLKSVRTLRAQVRAMPLDENARFEIDFRLRRKDQEAQQALLIANSIRLEALADDGVVVPGQPLKLSVLVANRGADVTVKQMKFDGFEGSVDCALTPVTSAGGRGRGAAGPPLPPISTLRKDQVGRCEPTVRIPSNARPSEPYWHRDGEAGRYTFDDDAPYGLPYRPTPFYVQATLAFVGGEEIIAGQPVEFRYEGNIFSGEKRAELLVVPALSVRVSPEVAIVPQSAIPQPAPPKPAAPARTPAARRPAARTATPAPTPAPAAEPASVGREVRVTIVNDTKGPIESVAKLKLPDGWTSEPAEQPVKFSREDEAQTVRFNVKPGVDAKPGEFRIQASVTAAGNAYERGFQVIEYPHIRRQHIYREADTALKVLDVQIAPNLTVGYVMGVGDDVPQAIQQLGVKVEMISPEDLAWGDLSRFKTIVTGVRAYERRPDLRANNSRLIDYVRDGGTLIVQYNKFEFNEAQYGPWPAKVSSDRVTDEFAAVVPLVPEDPVFTKPNKITDMAWQNWVQERGLYFLGERDSRYKDLVSLEDSFPYNKGEKRGALVQAQYGKGRWVYVGLGLWRELPAGVPGAYQLFANLISLGH